MKIDFLILLVGLILNAQISQSVEIRMVRNSDVTVSMDAFASSPIFKDVYKKSKDLFKSDDFFKDVVVAGVNAARKTPALDVNYFATLLRVEQKSNSDKEYLAKLTTVFSLNQGYVPWTKANPAEVKKGGVLRYAAFRLKNFSEQAATKLKNPSQSSLVSQLKAIDGDEQAETITTKLNGNTTKED